ncbi:hypothetical protein ACF058_30510 [Streptomyces sp. NPDC015501]|uniref:hypothetical protein n=1 Tax=Streptomyces sp. NPDC015501 TaxID=3364959 RepID=UPI0037032B6E
MGQKEGCPAHHGDGLDLAALPERADRFLAAAPEVPLLRWEDELPEPCVVHPEEVDTYPWAEDDTLPAALIARIDAWDDAQAADGGRDAPNYQGALSIPPG